MAIILARFQEIAMTTTRTIPFESVTVAERKLTTADGVQLTAQVYSRDQPARMTILMLPGIGVPQRAFRHLAKWFALRGARCVTVDYRGIGKSVTAKGIDSASLTAWAKEDISAAMGFCKSTGPEPVVLVGHSFGGQAVGLNKVLADVRAAVFIGSQFGQSRNWDGAERWRLAAYWHVILPVIASIYRVLPRWSGPAGPLPRGVAQEWVRWGRSRDWYVSQKPESVDLLAHFGAPILAYGMTDDSIAPPRAVTAFLKRFYATVPDRRDIGPEQVGLARIGHTGLLRPSEGVEVIWQEMMDFMLREATSNETCSAASAA